MRSTDFRWSNKITPGDIDEIRIACTKIDYQLLCIEDIFKRTNATHGEIQLVLNSASVVVDDLNTGLFHQTTLEALKAGALVLSAADPIAQNEAMTALDAPPLPLERVNNGEEAAAMLRSRGFHRDICRRRAEITEYAESYLGEARIAALYFEPLRHFLG
jgi:hypothetical protein